MPVDVQQRPVRESSEISVLVRPAAHTPCGADTPVRQSDAVTLPAVLCNV
jgi:hypothetical protein